MTGKPPSQTMEIKLPELGSIYVTYVYCDPVEIIINTSKSGSELADTMAGFTALLNDLLKVRSVPKVASLLVGIGFSKMWHEGVEYSSIPDAIGKSLLVLAARESKPNIEGEQG